jgi:hypothetical protein
MAKAVASPTLYEIEEGLTAFLDTAELVPQDQEEAFLADFRTALTAAAGKRDQVAHFLAFLEAQQAYAGAEITRLQALKKHYAAVQERLEGYVSYCIQALGRDAKGKYRKLEGHTTVMFLRAVPASVDITDEAAVPLDYKRAGVALPAALWNDVLNALDEDLRGEVLAATASTLALSVDKRAVKAAIDAGEDVPGAKLLTGKTTMGRK